MHIVWNCRGSYLAPRTHGKRIHRNLPSLLKAILQDQTAQEPACEVPAVSSNPPPPPSQQSPHRFQRPYLLPTSHLDDATHVDPPLTCKEIVIVGLMSYPRQGSDPWEKLPI